ncbi:MAG: zinc ribbon domain-containing protein [Oscillospiraceae bacterium]|nr:zinc ribbon domain-containing protein [Oscillospiraceae bacterium]
MNILCDYCGQKFDSVNSVCPHCGAPSDGLIRDSSFKPRTIEELKNFCASHHMPLEKMRFFIGEDYKYPRAFGIYQDEWGNFVVYKNKADGTRAVRYQGRNQEYAVSEIYEKLKSEILLRKQKQGGVSRSVPESASRSSGLSGSAIKLGFFAIVAAILIAVSVFKSKNPNRGYYQYNNDTYYYQSGDWYYYDDSLYDWILYNSVDQELRDNYGDYFESSDYSSSYGASDFSDTDYYQESDSSSDWDDSDWDSDYDSWDSSDTDWGSDW